MAELILNNVTINFPIYSDVSRSIKKSLIKKIIGGEIINYDNSYTICALNKINLHLKSGDTLGIMGDNGSGKTTLLRVLSGLIYPSQGSAIIKGNVTSFIEMTSGMNMEATGLENILLKFILLGYNSIEIKNVQNEIIEFSELGKYINLPLKTYSSGMVMRLAFSILAYTKSEIIIMDEWISVGDEHFKIKVNKKLEQILSESKIFIMASHSQTFINKFCKKIIKLDHGKQIL